MEQTNLPFAPWHVIDSTHRKQSEIDCLEILCSSIEQALMEKEAGILPISQTDPQYDPKLKTFPLVTMPLLADIPLDQEMSREEYKKQLKFYQKKLAKLHDQIYRWKIPVILAYEGWDAAGKGGNIKRITGALDPRGYQVIPVAAPKPYVRRSERSAFSVSCFFWNISRT